jgi:hypothetical protein
MQFLGQLFLMYKEDIENFLSADKSTGEEVLFDLRRFAEAKKQERKQVCQTSRCCLFVCFWVSTEMIPTCFRNWRSLSVLITMRATLTVHWILLCCHRQKRHRCLTMASPLVNQFVDGDKEDEPPTHMSRSNALSSAAGCPASPKTPVATARLGATGGKGPAPATSGAMQRNPSLVARTPLSTSKTPQGLVAAATAVAVVNGMCSLAQLSTPRIRKVRQGVQMSGPGFVSPTMVGAPSFGAATTDSDSVAKAGPATLSMLHLQLDA